MIPAGDARLALKRRAGELIPADLRSTWRSGATQAPRISSGARSRLPKAMSLAHGPSEIADFLQERNNAIEFPMIQDKRPTRLRVGKGDCPPELMRGACVALERQVDRRSAGINSRRNQVEPG